MASYFRKMGFFEPTDQHTRYTPPRSKWRKLVYWRLNALHCVLDDALDWVEKRVLSDRWTWD